MNIFANVLNDKTSDYLKRFLKYIIMGLIMFLSIRYIISKNIDNKEILLVSAVSSISFGLLDIFSPSIKINK